MGITVLLMAFGGGMLSFLSPCILPIAPGYLCIISGISLSNLQSGVYSKQKILKATVVFILGFSLIFVILGASSSFLGQLLRSNRPVISRIGGLVVILLGLHQTGLLPIAWLYRERRIAVKQTLGLTGAFLTGLAFAVGWTPCVGPILGSILTLAGSRGNLSQGIVLLAVYALGLAVPFFLLALAFEFVSKYISRLKPYLLYLQWAAGGLLMVMGVLLLTGSFTVLNSLIMRWTGGWSPESILGK